MNIWSIDETGVFVRRLGFEMRNHPHRGKFSVRNKL